MSVSDLAIGGIFTLQDTVWDDLFFPLTRDRQGAASKPDYDFTNLGLLFPQNDATEIAYLTGQFSHRKKLGTDIYPHIHYLQSQSDTPTWKMDYRIYDNGEDPTGGFTTIAATGSVFAYTSGDICQIATWPAIDMSGESGVSSMIEIKLYRDDNLVAGDVLAKQFDIHFEIERLGSDELWG